MKLDDLLSVDSTTAGSLDPDLISALTVFGFVNISYSLYHRSTSPPPYVGILAGVKSDGTGHQWTGTGNTPEEAQLDAIDSLAKWLMNQPIPYYPTAGVTP